MSLTKEERIAAAKAAWKWPKGEYGLHLFSGSNIKAYEELSEAVSEDPSLMKRC